jgi:hypothetical protein
LVGEWGIRDFLLRNGEQGAGEQGAGGKKEKFHLSRLDNLFSGSLSSFFFIPSL